VKVLGVDDWAWRRGHRYGTVLVDLERRKPIDLLPDRESETLAKWLQAHPTVRIISRDRAGAYADGARQGAPNAMQVADRFHLFCNLSDALKRVLERLVTALQHIQPMKPTSSTGGEPVSVSDQAPVVPGEPQTSITISQHEAQRQHCREKRKALYDAVKAAHERGLTKRAIARELNINRRTVRRFLHAEEFPERAPRRRRSQLDKYREYLEKRWAEGCHNAAQLCRELRERGYGGQRSRVKEYVQSWRGESVRTPSSPTRKLPSLKLLALWLAKEPKQRSPQEQSWVEAITSAHSQIISAAEIAQQFRQCFQNKSTEALTLWIERGSKSGIPEIRTFAAGIQRDYDAVSAAVVQSWSNGPVEGQVHRLKMLKRQMYGRGGFSLLRLRVLPFPARQAQRSP
jgi:transposase